MLVQLASLPRIPLSHFVTLPSLSGHRIPIWRHQLITTPTKMVKRICNGQNQRFYTEFILKLVMETFKLSRFLGRFRLGLGVHIILHHRTPPSSTQKCYTTLCLSLLRIASWNTLIRPPPALSLSLYLRYRTHLFRSRSCPTPRLGCIIRLAPVRCVIYCCPRILLHSNLQLSTRMLQDHILLGAMIATTTNPSSAISGHDYFGTLPPSIRGGGEKRLVYVSRDGKEHHD